MTLTNEETPVIECKNLSYGYNGKLPVLRNVNFELNRGERCLLIGANGSGKSTLLRIIGGKQLIKNCTVNVLGCQAYVQNPKGVVYMAAEWASNPLVRRDVMVHRLITILNGENWRDRVEYLIKLLEVDTEWHMHEISDGQRRRVQLLLGLMEPFNLLLMDEVTVELDVLVRKELLNYLKQESETRGASVLFATHIFDGLGDWATDVCHLSNGTVAFKTPLSQIKEFDEPQSNQTVTYGHSPLLRLVEIWLAKEMEERRKMYVDDNNLDVIELKKNAGKVFGDKYYNYWT